MNKNKKNAFARVIGGENYPSLRGVVKFMQRTGGVLVTAEIHGLPQQSECGGVFALHIHSGNSCEGNASDEFAAAKVHYNPGNNRHPCHAGDLPPLFSNNGYAYMQVLTNRFSVDEILGRTVIIHDAPDDFRSQPSGNSGNKIACGVIV